MIEQYIQWESARDAEQGQWWGEVVSHGDSWTDDVVLFQTGFHETREAAEKELADWLESCKKPSG